MTRARSALPILIGGTFLLGGVGLLAARRLRPKSVGLADADLASAEWHAVVEFESAEEGTEA